MMMYNSYINSLKVFLLIAIFAVGCKVQQKITSGKQAYELKQYSVAFKMLESEFKKQNAPEAKSYIAYLAGKSAMELNDIDSAIKWLEISQSLIKQEQSLFSLALAYKRKENYTKSLALLKELSLKYNRPEYNTEYTRLSNLISSRAFEPDETYQLKSLKVNTEYNDYSPSLVDDKYLLFSSDRPSGKEEEPYAWTGNYYSDLYLMRIDENTVTSFDPIINEEGNEGSACLSRDQDEIYFTRCENLELRDKYCRIYMSTKIQGTWTEPVAITFFEENVNVGHPSLMLNDSLLIFSVGPHGNYDSYDLYFSKRLATGWTAASYLEGILNTDSNEKFPTVTADTLFFSSDKPEGLGGLDIYKTYLNSEGVFERPERLTAPINSGADDFGYILANLENSAFEKVGYFSSSRGPAGDDNLYYFEKEFAKEEKDDSTPKEEKEPVSLFLAGKILDKSNGLPIPEATVLVSKDLDLTLKANKVGTVIFDGKLEAKYELKISKDGYFVRSKSIDLSELEIDKNLKSYTYNFKVELEPILVDEEIVIENIFYDFDKSNIRDDAKPALDSLVLLLQNNPEIKIELASHTDCKGEELYNLTLSLKRAKSAVKYMVEQGIANSRLQPKGYGENSPTINCVCDSCTDAERQQNRRTTFKVLNN